MEIINTNNLFKIDILLEKPQQLLSFHLDVSGSLPSEVFVLLWDLAAN